MLHEFKSPMLSSRKEKSGLPLLFSIQNQRIVLATLIWVSLSLMAFSVCGCSQVMGALGTSPTPTPTPSPSPTPTPVGSANDVLTYHNDNARTGQMLGETILTPANVNATNFGLLFVLPTDGKVDAQPLYAANVGGRNLLIVASEHGSVYAFDADKGTQIWQVSVIPGESPSDDHGCGQVTPEIGVTSTPTIDRTAGPSGTIYV